MADVKAALEGLKPVRGTARRRLRIGIAVAVFLILIGGFAVYRWQRTAARSLTERQLTANTPEARIQCAGISPDGKYLAYQDMSYTWSERDMKEYGDLAGVFLRSLDSGQTRPIRVPADLHRALAAIHWFPDGGKLLTDTVYGPFAIWVLPILGEAQPRMIYRGREPAISPDGRSIAFINGSRQELWVGGINGEPPVKLAAEEEKDSLFHPAWSPDGRWIAYWKVTGWPRTVTLEARPARGGPAITLAPGSDLPTTIGESWYASRSMIWTPDWRLVFALNEASPGIAGNADNDGFWDLRVEPSTCRARGKPERLTPRLGWNLRNLTITADGKRLAFVKERSQWDVYLGDLEGNGDSMKAPHRLTFDTQGSELQGWSRDSQAILITSRRRGKKEIFRQGLTETALEVLVEGSESVSGPAPTPDGLWLLYWEAAPGGRPLQRLMRRPAAGGSPEMVFETPATEWMGFDCPKRPGFPCEFSQKEGQDLVFYSVDPVRGKGERIGKIEIKPNPRGNTSFDWAFSTDGSRLGVVMDGEPRIAVLTLADRAWHDIPVPPRWGRLMSIGNGPDGDGFSVVSKSPGADKVLHVSAVGKVDLLLRKDWNEQGLSGVTASPDGKHLAFGAWTQESNVWMMENF